MDSDRNSPSAKSAAPPPSAPEKSPPPQPTRRRGGGFTFLIAASALGIAGYLAYQDFHSQREGPVVVGDSASAEIATMESRLAQLETRIGEIEDAPAAESPQNFEPAIQSLQTRIAQLESSLNGDSQNLSARIEALESATHRNSTPSENSENSEIALADVRLRLTGDTQATADSLARIAEKIGDAELRNAVNDDIRRLRQTPARAKIIADINSLDENLSDIAASQPIILEDESGDSADDYVVKAKNFLRTVFRFRKASAPSAAKMAAAEIRAMLPKILAAIHADDSANYRAAAEIAQTRWNAVKDEFGDAKNADEISRMLQSLAESDAPIYALNSAQSR